MPDTSNFIDPRQVWVNHMRQIGDAHGFFDRVGQRHMALFVDEGETLVLSFDRAERIWTKGNRGRPLGFACVTALEYSLLSLMSVGRTWFKGDGVDVMLKKLADEGFFAGFRQVLILASGPDCTHAAVRAAQYIKGAKLLLSRPVAAIGAAHAPFERRFVDARRVNPDGAFPMVPDTSKTPTQTVILYDPMHPSEAAQAALFQAPDTTRVALPHVGASLDRAMACGDALVPLAGYLNRGTLTAAKAREILRPVLRRDPDYLARLARAARAAGYPARAAAVPAP